MTFNMSIIFNFLFGISLGLIFGTFVIKRYVFHGPNSLDVQKKIFKDKGNCYKFKPKIVNCEMFNSHIN